MRVLVADDDEAVLLALELLLQREGMEVERARSPAQVLERPVVPHLVEYLRLRGDV